MIAALAGLFIALLAVALVLEPLIRASRGQRIEPGPSLFSEGPEDEDPVLGRRDRALAALREIEFDQATGKLSDEDFEKLYAQYSVEAVAALKGDDRSSDSVEALISQARARKGPRFCDQCGSALEGSRRFCVECGAGAAA